MADYNWDMKNEVGGYLGEENIPDMSTDNGHQDEFGFTEGDSDQRAGETFQGSSGRSSDDGNADSGVGGSKSCYGASASDCRSYVQSRFGLEGTTGSHVTERSDPHLGEPDTSSKAATDPRAPASDQKTAPDGDGWRPEDLMHTQVSKKHELMNKIKDTMPGHHEMTDPKGAPKKGVKEKIMEKLPGHHGNDAGM